MRKKHGEYIVVSTYAGATEEEFENIANDLKVVGRTDDPDQMRAWAQEIFNKTIQEDLDLFRDRYDEEYLKEYQEGFEVTVNSKETILDQERCQEPEKPIIIGTLYNYNDRRRYVDSIIVAAIKN